MTSTATLIHPFSPSLFILLRIPGYSYCSLVSVPSVACSILRFPQILTLYSNPHFSRLLCYATILVSCFHLVLLRYLPQAPTSCATAIYLGFFFLPLCCLPCDHPLYSPTLRYILEIRIVHFFPPRVGEYIWRLTCE